MGISWQVDKERLAPGDRVAFFPHGTPGPYRAFLGILRENRKRAKRERELEKEKTGCVSKRMG